MANPEHVEIVKQGAEAIREWQKRHRSARLDLSGADLHDTDLDGADLSYSNLSRANLVDAQLTRADVFEADLSDADLSGANLSAIGLFIVSWGGEFFGGADLSKANLSGANLSGAYLGGAIMRHTNLHATNCRNADLRGVDLRGADLTATSLDAAQIGWTTFCSVDLSIAEALETVNHDGPSTIGVDTLERSKGAIPVEFLRGCGLSRWEILHAKLYDPALTGAEITELQYNIFDARARGPIYLGGVFISYSHADSKFVDKVRDRLETEGAPVWLDRHDMVAGPLQKQVSRAIRLNDVVLLVLSEASIESDWVENELDMARRKEKEENRDVLCPVALDDSWKAKAFGEDTPDRQLWRTLAQKNVLDFSKWKTKVFEPQFQKLLRGMKIYYEPKK